MLFRSVPFRFFDCKTMDYHDHFLRMASTWMGSPVVRAIVERAGGAAIAAVAVVSALYLFRYLLSGA